MKRAIRLLRLIDLLNDRAYSTEELAERLDVAARTVRKDLADLRDDPLYLPLLKHIRHEWRLLDKRAVMRNETCR